MSVLRKRPVDLFVQSIDDTLDLEVNIRKMFKVLEYQPSILHMHLHCLLRCYFVEFTYDVAKDGSHVLVNGIRIELK